MANKAICNFSFRFKGDGAATSVVISLVNSPISFSIGTSGPTGFDIFSANPSEVYGVDAGDLSVSSASLMLGNLTVNFGSAPVNGTEYTVTGVLAF